jgi:hypothetical protein
VCCLLPVLLVKSSVVSSSCRRLSRVLLIVCCWLSRVLLVSGVILAKSCFVSYQCVVG